jgi:hypothetical protein
MQIDESQMISAYIDKPESEEFYKKAFEDYTKNGVEQFKWHWSWWAFGGGVFFLLYRKLYVEAAVFFLISMLSSTVPIANILIWILSGGVFPYFVFKRYKKGKEMVETNFENINDRLTALREFGGYNKWAIYIGVIITTISIGSMLYFTILLTAAPR